jgi:tripartite-type tricarboxylate transporter receptor subunit TctC
LLPDIPAVGEFVPGYEATGWQGIGAPRTTPTDIINKLNSEVSAALVDSKFRARLAGLAVTPFASSPANFGKFIVEYTEKWAKVIRFAGIKPE